MARILVVDDEELVRLTLRRMLEKTGHDLAEAANGEAAARALRRRRADLVITDIVMPKKDGIETIREFKQRYPEMRIIAMSGGGYLGEVDFLRMSRHLGADGILPKPFDADRLLAMVRELLGPEDGLPVPLRTGRRSLDAARFHAAVKIGG
jgi:CheY-like chemotaxis protein